MTDIGRRSGMWAAACVAVLAMAPRPVLAAVRWQTGVLEVTALGPVAPGAASVQAARTAAERAAHARVFQLALDEISAVPATSAQTAGERMRASAEVRARVEQVLRQYKVVETRYFADGAVEIVAQVSLGMIAGALLPPLPVDAAVPLLVAGTGVAQPAATDLGSPATGVVIDARGHNARAGFGVRVLAPDGRALFDARQVRTDVLRREGGCVYLTNLDDATRHTRVAERPRVIRAVAAQGTLSIDILLDAAGAARLSDLDDEIWSQGRVVVVLDTP